MSPTDTPTHTGTNAGMNTGTDASTDASPDAGPTPETNLGSAADTPAGSANIGAPAAGRRVRQALRIALSYYATIGLSAAVGLALVSAAMHLWAGTLAAAAASVGVIVAIPPDQPAPRRGKFRQLLPAALIGPPLFFAVQWLHTDALRLSTLLVPATFVAFLGAAWGKRGLPISMSIMFAMIFSMATPPPLDAAAALSTSLYFALGSVAYVVYATLANLVLNGRYRTLMLVDSLLAVASLMRTQAAQFTPAPGDATATSASADADLSPTKNAPLLGRLLRQQAALADQLQSARDILLESPRTAGRQRLAGMLVQLLELRDHLVACELDLDTLRGQPGQVPVLGALRRELETLAVQTEQIADAMLLGRVPAPFAGAGIGTGAGTSAGTSAGTGAGTSAATGAGTGAGAQALRERLARYLQLQEAHARTDARHDEAPHASHAPHASVDDTRAGANGGVGGPSPALLARGLVSRVGYIHDEVRRLCALARGDAKPDLAVVRAAWQMFTSPTSWSWRPFAALWRWDAPPLRHAIRAALAIAAGQVISVVLPWGTHDYWILLTITVVLRGSFAQTLERRNTRVAGTLLGCIVAGALLYARPPLALFVATVTVAQGIAHAFAIRRYLVTVVAATVLALLQAHLLNAGGSPVFEVAERVADTLIGVAIAWAFSYVLPSWERTQIPALVRRTLIAQARHAQVALGLGQLEAVDNESELGWRLARREVYDSLSALVQATQRSLSEPRAVRPPLAALERLTAHSYQLLAQLTAVKTMLLLRRGRLQAEQIREPLREAADTIARRLADGVLAAPRVTPAGDRPMAADPSDTPSASGAAATAAATAAIPDDGADTLLAAGPVALPDPFEQDLSPWLLRRLHLAAGIATQANSAARRVPLRATSRRRARRGTRSRCAGSARDRCRCRCRRPVRLAPSRPS